MKLGQAAVLSGKMWAQWTNHILKTSTTWLYVAIFLTHALCCRITEILKLKGADFNWAGKTVTVASLKRQPEACQNMCSWGKLRGENGGENCVSKHYIIYKHVFGDVWRRLSVRA